MAAIEPTLRIASYNVGVIDDDWAKKLPAKRQVLQKDIQTLMKSCQVVLLQELGKHDRGLDSLRETITGWITTVGTHQCFWGRCYLALVKNELSGAVVKHKVSRIFEEDDPGECIPGVPQCPQTFEPGERQTWSRQCRIAQMVSLDFSKVSLLDPHTRVCSPSQPRRLDIWNLHIPAGGRHPSTFEIRRDTVRRLSMHVATAPESVLIIGDLNIPTQQMLLESLHKDQTWCMQQSSMTGVWAVATRSLINKFHEPRVGVSNGGASDAHDAFILRWKSADCVAAAAAAASLPCIRQPSVAAKEAAMLLVRGIQHEDEQQHAADILRERDLQERQEAELKEVMLIITSPNSFASSSAGGNPATTAIATAVAASAMAHDDAAACTDVLSPSQEEASSLSTPYTGVAVGAAGAALPHTDRQQLLDALQEEHATQQQVLLDEQAAEHMIPGKNQDLFSCMKQALCLRVRAARQQRDGGPVAVWSQAQQETLWSQVLALRELFLTRIVYHHPRCTFATLEHHDVISPAAAAEILHMLKNHVQTLEDFQEELKSWEDAHQGAPKMGHYRAQFKRHWFNNFVHETLGHPKMVQAVIMANKWTPNMMKALETVRGKREQLWQQWQAQQDLLAEQAEQAEQDEQDEQDEQAVQAEQAQRAQQGQDQWHQRQSIGARGSGEWHSHQWQGHGWQDYSWKGQPAGAPLPGRQGTRQLRKERHKMRSDQRKASQGSAGTAPQATDNGEAEDIDDSSCEVCSTHESTNSCWLCNRRLCQMCSIPKDVRCLEPSTCRALRCRALREAGQDELAAVLEGGGPVPASGVHGELNRPALPKQTHNGPHFDGMCIEQLVREWISLEAGATATVS